jgi:hypothetical protein
MSGGRRIVHRLDEDGVLIDGPIPENSVNEQLVASGYWVPLNISKHPWERILYTYDEEMANPKWEDSYSRSEPKTASEKRMSIYSERITSAANSAYSSPNAYLGSCLEQKSDQVAFLLAQKEEEEQRNEDNRRRWAADVEAVWRSVFCPTMAEDFPKRCAKYNPEKDDKVGTGGGSGSSNWGGSGGGSNCTWVNSYTRRDGTRVSGYFRCG